jgi:hypothetical protein
MKKNTIKQFKAWSLDKQDDDIFVAGTELWTKHNFAVAFLGETPKKTANPINIDVKVELDADVERTFETGHIEESGD